MRKSTPFNDPQRGAGLLGVIITAFCISLILAAMSIWLGHLAEERAAVLVRTNRDRIATQVQSQSEMASSLSASARLGGAGNRALLACLKADGSACRVTDASRPQSFRLVVPYSADTPPVAVAGNTRNPVRYNMRGVPQACKPSSKCPFEVVTYFWATCPDETKSTCDRAHRINVRRRVSVAKGVSFDNGPVPAPVPGDREWKEPTFDSVSVLVDDIMGENNVCTPGARLIGLDDKGLIKCGCRPGFTQGGLDAFGRITCMANGKFCADKEVFQGFDKFTKPICVSLPATSYSCVTKKIGARNGRASCPDSSWKMRALNIASDCYMVKSGGQDIVECPNVEMTCCRLK